MIPGWARQTAGLAVAFVLVLGLGGWPGSAAWAAEAASLETGHAPVDGIADEVAHGGEIAPETVYDAVRVVERALTHHLGVRAGQLQYWLGQARAEQTRAQLRPILSAEASPFGFGQQVTEPDIDLERLQDAWENGRYLEVLEILWDFVSRMEGGQLPMRERDLSGIGYRVGFSLRTPVWTSTLQEAMGALADLESHQALADAETAVGMAIVQSLEAYYGVLRAEAARRVAAAALREAEFRSREQASRLEAGTATEVDWLQAEAERYRAQAELVRAEGELRAARMALNQSLGFPLETQLALVEWMPPPTWPSPEEALHLARQRDEMQKAQRDLERAQAAQVIAQEQAKPVVQLVGRYRWPDVELSLSLDRHGYLGAMAAASQQFLAGSSVGSQAPNWMAGVELRWPLLDGQQRRAELAQAALQVELAALQLEQLEQSTRTEVLAAHARLVAASEALQGAEQGVGAARRGLAIAQQLRATGAATEGDVLRAETVVARAEQARLEAAYAVALAQTAYLRAAGILVPHWLEIVGQELQLERLLERLEFIGPPGPRD